MRYRPLPGYALVNSLSHATRSCSSFAPFDAIFELAPIVRELLGHGVGSARHIATDCRPDVHGLTNLKFMRRHRYVGTSFICLRAIAANIPELFRSPDKPSLAELLFFVGC